MEIVISNNKWIHLENVTPDVDDLIYNHFSAKSPNAKYIDDVQEQSWDGYYRKYNRRKQSLSKAYLNELIHLCKKHDIPITITDNRDPSKYPMFNPDDVRPDILPGITLEGYQVEGIKACAKRNRNGIYLNEIATIYFTTGAGKTEIICAIAKLLNCPTIIIAEETVVVDQIKERLELREVVDEVGVFYAGQSPDGQLICVGSLASLSAPPKISRKKNEKPETYEARLKAVKTRRRNHKAYKKILAKCELLMIDEVDKAATNKLYKKVVRQYANPRYVYGFTGTLPMPEDELDVLNLKEIVGSVVAKSDRRHLEKIGRIIPVKYIMTVFGENNKNDKSAFDIAVKEQIEENSDLHNHVKTITDKLPNDNFLILVEKIQLGKNLEELIPNSVFIHGTTGKKVRNEALKNFGSRKTRILIGSRILERGLDIKGGIDNLIICASSKKDSKLEQKVGRALRVNDRGFARVFDFIYIGNYYLYRHSRQRLKRMIQLGYPVTVVTPKKNLDGKDVIKHGFNLFRYI